MNRIAILFFMAISFCCAKAVTPVQKWGQLQVKGSQLCNARGEAVALRGVSFGWHNLSPRFYTTKATEWLINDWHASVIRASMGIQFSNSYIENPEMGMKSIETIVDACIKNGTYVIIDWHAHEMHQPEAVAFFGKMAKKYAKYPNVIYELFNEPVNQSWESLKVYATACIKEIRKYDRNNIILVGCPHWDQDINLVAKSPLVGFNNIMYTVHFYSGTHKQELRNRTLAAIKKGIPVFVSECGYCDADGKGKLDTEGWNTWVEMMEKNKISWVAWSIADKDETCSMLYPSASSDGEWYDIDISPSGELVKRTLFKYNSDFIEGPDVEIQVKCVSD